MSFFRAIWRGNLRHKKLYDEGTLTGAFDCEPMTDPPLEEVVFRAKYLGSTLIDKAANEAATAEAIKTVLTMAKAAGRKLQRVAVSLSLAGIKVVDVPTEEVHLEVSIYSISYCSADAAHSQVFAFIATNANEIMECHAFLCRKRKTAQIMSLTLARVFRTAYDLLADGFHGDKFIIGDNRAEEKFKKDVLRNETRYGHVETALLIDFSSDLRPNTFGTWECFDESPSNRAPHTNRPFEEHKKCQTDALVPGKVCWQNTRTDLLCS